MTHPQQPELTRSDYGDATQDAKELRASQSDTPSTGGNTGRTPQDNQTEDARRSGEKSTTYDAAAG